MKSLSKILSILLLFVFNAEFAFARGHDYRDLIINNEKKINKVRSFLRQTKLLKFTTVPNEPKVNEQISLFIQPLTSFSDTEMILDTKLDGVSTTASLQHPTEKLWMQNVGSFTEVGSHLYSGKVFLRDTNTFNSITAAIAQLDLDIAEIDQEIANETDSQALVSLNNLKAQRVAQKNTLITQIASLNTEIANEDFDIQINQDTSDASYPKITSVFPNVFKINTGSNFVIFGSNFNTSPIVKINGQSINVLSYTSTSINVQFPLLAAGIYDLEVKIFGLSGYKNVISKGAIFVSDSASVNPNGQPMAVANVSNASFSLGSSVTMSGSNSFDSAQRGLIYQWKFLSVPSSSNAPTVGTVASTNSNYTYTPNVPGLYAVQLIVTQTTSPNLSSDPVVAVFQVNPPANRAPTASASPASITVVTGQSTAAQISVTDPDFWQTSSFVISKQSTLGTATVSGGGLISFSAGVSSGSDSIQVTVVDSGSPSLSTIVTIPVTVNMNTAPTASANPSSFNVGTNATKYTQINASDSDAGQTLSYSVAQQTSLGTASIDSGGKVTFTAGSTAGSGNIKVTVSDNGVPVKSVDVIIPITVVTNQIPVVTSITKQQRSQGLPVSIALVPTGLSDPDGSFEYIQYDMGDGTLEYAPIQAGSNLGVVIHNYQAYGTYNVTMRAVDNLGGVLTYPFSITVTNTDIPTAKFSLNKYSCSSPCSVSADATAATDSNGITQYRWLWGDGSAEETGSGTSYKTRSHTFNSNGTYKIRLRTRDTYTAQGESFATVYVGGTAPATGSPPQSTMINLSAREIPIGNTASFDATRSFDPNPSGSINAYQWNLNDCATGTCTPTTSTASTTYSTAGSKFVNVKVTGALGGQSTSSGPEILSVTTGHAPKAVIAMNNEVTLGSTVTAAAPLQINFDAEVSFDYDGTISSYLWNFGDSTTSTSNFNSKTFSTPGTYQVSLKVTDNDGNSHTAFQTIVVTSFKSEALKAKKAKRGNFYIVDEEVDENRKSFERGCGLMNGEACYELAKIYRTENIPFAARGFNRKACGLGFVKACGVR